MQQFLRSIKPRLVVFVLLPSTGASGASGVPWVACEQAGKKPDEAIAACTFIISKGPGALKAAAFHNRGLAHAA